MMTGFGTPIATLDVENGIWIDGGVRQRKALKSRFVMKAEFHGPWLTNLPN